jgi:hypothetical protein
MSRHARHRVAEQRRPGPAGRTEGSQPVRLATPEAAHAGSPAPGVPPPAVLNSPAAVPMASQHVPTTTAAIVDETGGLPAGLPGGLPVGLPGGGCTPAQLRRFIKSRAYLPVHEIRRRFGIESADDDVTGFEIESGRVFVGLPLREGRILGDLVRAGEVGYELQLDPESPIIVGVYPMRPVTRQ